MSHRAIVGIQRGDDSYDLYYSHNGAHNLQLLDQLRENADSLCRPASTPHGFSTTHAPQLQKWETSGQRDDLAYQSNITDGIEAEPMATDVPLAHVGVPIEFDNIEAFYLVRDESVTPYVPIWLWPNVIRPIREHLEIEVYRGGRLEADPMEMMDRLEDDEPLEVLNADTLALGSDWLSNTVRTTILRDHHAAIYALWRQVNDQGVPDRLAADADSNEKPDPCGALHLDNFVVLFRVLDPDASPPPSRGLGVFVELPGTATGADREQVWSAGSQARFNLGAMLNAYRAEPDEDDITDSISDVFMELHETFGDRIAEHSPPPGGLLIQLLNRLDATSDLNAALEASATLGSNTVQDLFTEANTPESLDLPNEES